MPLTAHTLPLPSTKLPVRQPRYMQQVRSGRWVGWVHPPHRTRTVHNQPVGRTYQKISKQYRVGWRLFKCPRHLFSTLSSGNASSGSPTVNLTRGLRQYVASSTSPCLSAFHGGCWSWQPQPIALQNGYSAEGKSVHCVSSHAGLAWEAMEANLKERTQAASASR